MPKCSALALFRLVLKPENNGGPVGALADLVLTCGSEKSRNFRYGHGAWRRMPRSTPRPRSKAPQPARAVARLARDRGVDMPISRMVAAVLDGMLTLTEAKGATACPPP